MVDCHRGAIDTVTGIGCISRGDGLVPLPVFQVTLFPYV